MMEQLQIDPTKMLSDRSNSDDEIFDKQGDGVYNGDSLPYPKRSVKDLDKELEDYQRNTSIEEEESEIYEVYEVKRLNKKRKHI